MPIRRDNYADMEKFKKTRYEQRKRYYHKSEGIYEKRPWIKEEEKQVLAHSITDTELSKKIRRSVKAIQVRRSKLKKEMNLNNE